MPSDRPASVMTFRSNPVKYISTTANSTDGDTDADHQRGLDVLQEDGQHDDGQCGTHQHTGEDALDEDMLM